MTKPSIGLTGLGVMGSNLALNIADNGFDLAVHNRTNADVDRFLEKSGDLRARLTGHYEIEDFIAGIATPRTIIMMVKAGSVVDAVIAALTPHLEKGDLLIDAGNSDFNDTVRRTKTLEDQGFGFLGIGVSGGEVGARFGPSTMAGGSAEKYALVEDMLNAIAAKHEGEPCAAWLGPDGAGHFVKTMHNGIEYGDMQMIAETYGVMRNGLGMEPKAIGKVFERWNEGALGSYLIEITAQILQTEDPQTGADIIDVIVDRAGQKGTGRWSAIESQKLGVPASAIEAAVTARALSAGKDQRETMERLYGTPDTVISSASMEAIITQLENALLAGKIIAYAQGFSVIRAASEENGWNTPLARVAEIWRAGCIIRSVMLNDIASAFANNPALESLLLAPAFADKMKATHADLRTIVALTAQHALPLPALSAALSYFDYARQGQSTANILQAQRDFFGAHGFERTDEEGSDHHGPWAMG
ncbi:NADP-dependent phosphogluconate dehydrogenase [Pseudahrensia aquimaris]|uniref:6-phosphogluconate dehydrogenase, decarboxylating n=1 Tax=Pseudahrensia aquimaris TaxID=744461 RepID=A0ABW3FHP0_9HYPH